MYGEKKKRRQEVETKKNDHFISLQEFKSTREKEREGEKAEKKRRNRKSEKFCPPVNVCTLEFRNSFLSRNFTTDRMMSE